MLTRDTEVTVCMHTYNAFEQCDFPAVLRALWFQMLPINVLVADNGSGDMTDVYLKAAEERKYFTARKPRTIRLFKYVGQVAHYETKALNSVKCKERLLLEVTTPYVFFLDSDVFLLPSYLGMLLSEMKQAGPKTGALGIPYTATDHPKVGALLMRTKDARAAKWSAEGRCECTRLARALREKGMETRHWSLDLWAVHLSEMHRNPEMRIRG